MLHPSLHGGDIRAASRKLGCRPEEILDFSASINPLGPPAWLRSVVAANLAGVAHYPEPRARSLRRAAACRLGLVNHSLLECFQQDSELRICNLINSMPNRFRRKTTHFAKMK